MPGRAPMRFAVVQDYPAGLDRLWTAFGQPEYPLQKYRALGALAVRLRRFEATPQRIEVELERDVPTDPSDLPVWARAFVRSTQTLTHRSSWRRVDASRAEAELEIVPRGLPVRARADGVIAETGAGRCRMTLAWEVHSRLGTRTARLFAAQVQRALDEDHAYTLRVLGQASTPGAAPKRGAAAPSA
jgi:Protein of unknown function (DUF2505)